MPVVGGRARRGNERIPHRGPHVLPNTWRRDRVATRSLGAATLTESSPWSFLGLGIGAASLMGRMLSESGGRICERGALAG